MNASHVTIRKDNNEQKEHTDNPTDDAQSSSIGANGSRQHSPPP